VAKTRFLRAKADRAGVAVAILVFGCGGEYRASTAAAPTDPLAPTISVAEGVRSANVSVLYFGNSHTGFHDVPGLVGKMIRFKHPNKRYFHHFMSVGFLEDAARNPGLQKEIEDHPWKFVVLQAQKISVSGKYKYSQKDGITLAKSAKERGAQALFFSEWGRRDVAMDGVVQESIYQEMANAAGVRVAPVGRAWDIALAEKPSLPLYSWDGNHESEVGAFLTACVLYGLMTDSDPAQLADYDYPAATSEDRIVMADAASEVWKQEREKNK
jgi:hypothetical protein